MVPVSVEGCDVKGLVDSGSTRSIVGSHLVSRIEGKESRLMAVNGETVSCLGTAKLQIGVAGRSIQHEFIVMRDMVPGIEVILGIDLIDRMGGVRVGPCCVEFDHANTPDLVATCLVRKSRWKLTMLIFRHDFMMENGQLSGSRRVILQK